MSSELTSWREVRAGGLRLAHAAGIDAQSVLEAVAAHRTHAARRHEGCEHWSRKSSVSRVPVEAADGPLELAVKWSHWRGWRGAVGDALRGSRAARALAGARLAAAAGVAHAEHLAIAERRSAGLVRESFALMRFAAGPGPLSAVVPGLRDDAGRRRRVAERLAELLATLHAAGLDATDLKHSNLWLAADDRVLLLDLEALERPARLGWEQRVRALGQLEAYARDLHPWLPPADRLRFLRRYLELSPDLMVRRRELARAVDGWAALRVAQWAQEERPKRYPLVPRDA